MEEVLSEEDIKQALRWIIDPVTGISVVDMGLIGKIEIDGGNVKILMSRGDFDPEALRYEVEKVLGSLSGLERLDLEIHDTLITL